MPILHDLRIMYCQMCVFLDRPSLTWMYGIWKTAAFMNLILFFENGAAFGQHRQQQQGRTRKETWGESLHRVEWLHIGEQKMKFETWFINWIWVCGVRTVYTNFYTVPWTTVISQFAAVMRLTAMSSNVPTVVPPTCLCTRTYDYPIHYIVLFDGLPTISPFFNIFNGYFPQMVLSCGIGLFDGKHLFRSNFE